VGFVRRISARWCSAGRVATGPEEGFGRGGVGFGRRRGSFGLFRILFALLFTTLLGPIVLVALIAFVAYRFFANRRRG
jgi:hypothetical protein